MSAERVIKEVLQLPDKAKTLLIDPDDLMRDNPAALIVNRESYESMKAFFSEIRFRGSPPQVVRVKINTPTGETERLFVQDGLTRTKFASDHKGKILSETPHVKFDTILVLDITDDVLKDPRIVLPQERQPGQKALTMLQYLRAVVPPTIVHSEIATDRITGHLINAWEGMVGSDLIEKFPALSALSFIANDRIPIATDAELRKTLARQSNLVTNENTIEREILEKALRDIAAIIRQSKLPRGDIEKSAYFLVGSGSSVIGGSEKTRREIFGLLRSPSFERKLVKEYKDTHLGEIENNRLALGRVLESVFNKFSDGSMDGERTLSDVKRALDDESITISQTFQIVTSDSPTKTYDEVRRNNNKEALKEQYKIEVRRKVLTDVEETFIANLGKQTYLLESKIPSMIKDVQFCAAIVRQAQEWQEQLRTDADDFVKRGVQRVDIDQATAQITQKLTTLMAADSIGTLSDRAKQLQLSISESKNKFAIEMLKYSIGERVEKFFGAEANLDPEFQDRVVHIIIRSEEIDALKPADVNKWLVDLKNLDPDLQIEVIGGMKMAPAKRMQARRRARIEESTREEIAPPIAPPPQRDEPIVEVPPQFHPAPVEPRPVVSPETINRRRVEMNIRRLNEEIIESHLIPAIRLFGTLDLKPEEVPAYLKRILGEAEIAIEKLRGGHPNVVRVIDVEYNKLLKDMASLRAAIIDNQTHKQTRDSH